MISIFRSILKLIYLPIQEWNDVWAASTSQSRWLGCPGQPLKALTSAPPLNIGLLSLQNQETTSYYKIVYSANLPWLQQACAQGPLWWPCKHIPGSLGQVSTLFHTQSPLQCCHPSLCWIIYSQILVNVQFHQKHCQAPPFHNTLTFSWAIILTMQTSLSITANFSGLCCPNALEFNFYHFQYFTTPQFRLSQTGRPEMYFVLVWVSSQ